MMAVSLCGSIIVQWLFYKERHHHDTGCITCHILPGKFQMSCCRHESKINPEQEIQQAGSDIKKPEDADENSRANEGCSSVKARESCKSNVSHDSCWCKSCTSRGASQMVDRCLFWLVTVSLITVNLRFLITILRTDD